MINSCRQFFFVVCIDVGVGDLVQDMETTFCIC